MSASTRRKNGMKTYLINWVSLSFYLLMLSVILAVTGATTTGVRLDSAPNKEVVKLRALADKLVLMSRGLTSSQSAVELELAEEFVPLAEFTIQQLGKK